MHLNCCKNDKKLNIKQHLMHFGIFHEVKIEYQRAFGAFPRCFLVTENLFPIYNLSMFTVALLRVQYLNK